MTIRWLSKTNYAGTFDIGIRKMKRPSWEVKFMRLGKGFLVYFRTPYSFVSIGQGLGR